MRKQLDALGGLSVLQLDEARRTIVTTEDLALLQEAGVYHYRHPLTDAVSYERELAKIEESVREMIKKDGGAVLAAKKLDRKWLGCRRPKNDSIFL